MAKRKPKDAPAAVSPHTNGTPQYRLRITGYTVLENADEILNHQNNWRTHGEEQRAALRGVLNSVGVVGAALGYYSKEAGGKLKLIDGHLRKEEIRVGLPVLLTDLDDNEAAQVLATFDPISAMADADAQNLTALLHQITSGDAAVQQMLTDLAEQHRIIPAAEVPLDGFFEQEQHLSKTPKEKLILQYPPEQMPAVRNALAVHGDTPEQALLNLLDL
jgi:hypothetical protein